MIEDQVNPEDRKELEVLQARIKENRRKQEISRQEYCSHLMYNGKTALQGQWAIDKLFLFCIFCKKEFHLTSLEELDEKLRPSEEAVGKKGELEVTFMNEAATKRYLSEVEDFYKPSETLPVASPPVSRKEFKIFGWTISRKS